MFGATAATLPWAMATSRTALRLFFASMTCPPFSSRSYFCCAGRRVAAPAIMHAATAQWNRPLMTSTPSIVVPLCRPPGGQVLAHVERPGHRVALDGAGETEAQRVAVTFGIGARNLHRVPVDGSRQIAGDEVALVQTFEAVAGLLQVQRVRRCARKIVDTDIPLPADVRRRRGDGRGRCRSRRFRQRRVD